MSEDPRTMGEGPVRMKLMSDYHCFPLWDLDQPRNIDPRLLDITDVLAEDLLRWASECDSTLNEDYPPESGFASDDARERWYVAGRQLAERLASELGSAAHIEYWREPGEADGIEVVS